MHTQSDSIAALAAALAKAQAAIPPAPKNAENPHYRSHYADLASVWGACRAPLAAHGIAVIQSPARSENGLVTLSTTLAHASGEWMTSIVAARPAKDDAQGLGSVITYLRRYALAAMVGVTSCEDDDAQAAVARSAPIAESVAAQPQQRHSRPIAIVRDESLTAANSDDSSIITEVVPTDGVGKNGKQYRRFTIRWTHGGQSFRGSTLSATVGAAAQDALAGASPVSLMSRVTQYGLDVVSIYPVIDEATSAKMEVTDEIPF